MKIVISNQKNKERFNHSKEAKELIRYIIKLEKKRLGEINIIFTSNSEILKINKSFLKHHYYTDVITFCNEKRNVIAGDMFISIDQVVINAKKCNTQKLEELFRIIIHGVLHLMGYTDNEPDKKKIMSEKEDIYLKHMGENIDFECDEAVL